MTRQSTNFFEIEQDFLDIFKVERELLYINISNGAPKTRNSIGRKQAHIKLKNYYEYFNEISFNGSFEFQLFDESLLSLFYQFDNEGKLISHSLAYLPNPKIDLETDFEKIDKIDKDNEDDGKVQNRINGYLRIDFNNEGYDEYYHSYTHLHIGFSDYIRIPINHFIKPKEFLWFILKYIYRQSDEQIKYIEPNQREDTSLTSKELSKVFLNFYSTNKP